jgi:hypothetical protein
MAGTTFVAVFVELQELKITVMTRRNKIFFIIREFKQVAKSKE